MMDNDLIHRSVHQALFEGDTIKVIMLLRDNDIDVNFRDVTHDLQTILMKLCYVNIDITSLKGVLENIFEKFPDVNLQDSWGRTVLMHACIANKPVIIESLLEFEQTEVSLTDFDGNSALSYAVQNCDLYTLEDILQHPSGPRLLSIHNSKGQTPVTIAEKSGEKAVIKLFRSYVDKTIGLQQKKKNRNHRDAIKLKAAPSVRQERLNLSSAPVESTSEPASSRTDKNKLLSRPRINLSTVIKSRETQEKCDSAPVTRTNPNTFDKTQIVTSLQLSSPKLQRRFHKENSLLEECFKRNNINILPPMKLTGDSTTIHIEKDFDLPEYSIRRQRRPSISLPDLRNVTGCLVNSGSSTPCSDTREDTDCHILDEYRTINYEINDNEDVFAHTFPAQKRRLHKTSSKQSLNDSKVSLPDIHKTLSQHDVNKKVFPPLNRPRKFSNSDDQLQRTLLINDNG